MPECVEVKIITEQLQANLAGKTTSQLQPFGRFLRQPIPGLNQIQFPLKIESIHCKGKFIYWKLEQDWYLWNTLGMTGSWNLPPQSQKPESSIAALMTFTDGSEAHFNDARHFGTLKFIQGQDKLQAKLNELGPDLLAGEVTKEYLELLFEHKKIKYKTLAEVLMNQKNIAGVGNYIKSEALYRARLSPWRTAGSLSSTEITRLLEALMAVVTESYQERGATLATYKDTEGSAGRFAQFLRVYRKDRDPEGRAVKNEETLDKRTSWWVPEVQL